MKSLTVTILLTVRLVNAFHAGHTLLSCRWHHIPSTVQFQGKPSPNGLVLAMSGRNYAGVYRRPSSEASTDASNEMPYEIVSDMIAEADAIFDIIDTNNDGEISNDELQLHLETNGFSTDSIRYLFTAMDKNADGVISREEMRFAFSNYESIALYMAFGLGDNVSGDAYNDAVKAIRSSANIDNNLSPELLTRLADLIFDMIDTDKSGEIDTQEIKDFFRESESTSFREVGNTSVIAANNIFRALDLDSNSSISRQEMRDGFMQYDPRVLSKAFGLRVARTSEM